MRSTQPILNVILLVAAMSLATASHAAVTISNAKTRNMNCSGGVCTPTGGNANINVSELETMLASSDVTVKSTAAVSDIAVLDALTWASAHRLTLDAYESIHVRAPVVAEGTSGITLTTNDGGTGGDYNFNTKTSGSITFWDTASSLIINGQSFTLVSDIKTLASDVAANASGNYALARSYDASVDGEYHAAPVTTPFQGALDGLGNTISNMQIRSTTPGSALGLIAEVNGGTIANLNLSHVHVSGGAREEGLHDNIGSLVGALVGGLVKGCSADGELSGRARHAAVGGLVGSVMWSGTVLQSSATVQIGGGAGSGGLVGVLEDGQISLSHASGVVHGRDAGGLVGDSSGGTISQSFASADVISREGFAGGGLVGVHDTGNILQSFATGSVFSKGRFSTKFIGGFIGNDYAATTSQSYATGLVSNDNGCAGGFVAFPGGQYSGSYWDVTTTRQNHADCGGNPSGITGLTDDQLKSGLPDGFDPAVWGQDPNINNGWPYLLANPPQ